MRLSDSMREGIQKKKGHQNVKNDVRDAFNNVSLKLIKQFIEGVETGTIEVSDISDVMRLYNMYLSVNELQGGDEGSGTLPALPRGQRDIFLDSIKTIKAPTEEEEDIDYIVDSDFENKTAEDIEKLLTQREMEVNKENEGMF